MLWPLTNTADSTVLRNNTDAQVTEMWFLKEKKDSSIVSIDFKMATAAAADVRDIKNVEQKLRKEGYDYLYN